jgi:hypothetical protein
MGRRAAIERDRQYCAAVEDSEAAVVEWASQGAILGNR